MSVKRMMKGYEAKYGKNAAINLKEVQQDIKWLRETSDPALGSTTRTPIQTRLAAMRTRYTRLYRVLQEIEAAVEAEEAAEQTAQMQAIPQSLRATVSTPVSFNPLP